MTRPQRETLAKLQDGGRIPRGTRRLTVACLSLVAKGLAVELEAGAFFEISDRGRAVVESLRMRPKAPRTIPKIALIRGPEESREDWRRRYGSAWKRMRTHAKQRGPRAYPQIEPRRPAETYPQYRRRYEAERYKAIRAGQAPKVRTYRKNALTDLEKAEIARLRQLGAGVRKMAAELGRAAMTVRRYAATLPAFPRPAPPEREQPVQTCAPPPLPPPLIVPRRPPAPLPPPAPRLPKAKAERSRKRKTAPAPLVAKPAPPERLDWVLAVAGRASWFFHGPLLAALETRATVAAEIDNVCILRHATDEELRAGRPLTTFKQDLMTAELVSAQTQG